MTRVAVALLLGGVALLVSWAIAPASLTTLPGQASGSPAPAQADAIVADVNAQVDRMRARLLVSTKPSEPSRDPFRFGTRADRQARTPAATQIAEAEAPAPVVLPKLLAIVDDSVPGGARRDVVVAFGGDIHILKVGDVVGPFVVRAIDERGADLADSATLHVYRITLQ